MWQQGRLTMSLALDHSFDANTARPEPDGGYDAAEAFAAFGEPTAPQDWRPLSAEEFWRLAAPEFAAPANEHRAPPRPFPSVPTAPTRLDAALIMRLAALADWLALALAADFAARWGAGVGLLALPLDAAWPIAAAFLALKSGLWLTGAYAPDPAGRTAEHATGGLVLGAIAAICVAGLAAPDAREAAALAAAAPGVAIALALMHAALAVVMRRAWRQGAFSETVVVVCATEAAARFVARARKDRSARVVAIVDDRAARAPAELAGAPVAGDVRALLAWPDLPHVDRIVIAAPPAAEARISALLDALEPAPQRVELLFDIEAAAVQGRRLTHAGGAPLALLRGGRLRPAYAYAKRSVDVAGALVLLAALSPLMALIAACIRIESAGPALFRQRRHGLNGREFTVWKFRTLRVDKAAGPLVQVTPGDARVTRFGAVLRRTSLDELPQIWNILRGDMSFVGPRPLPVDLCINGAALHEIAPRYAHRHRVKPGLTGWAQVMGARGPMANAEALRTRVRFDLDYAARCSLWFDAWIVLRTLPVLLGERKNAR
jgi:exopolysaccharide biosynthesis polyprenyl glycosylphosphotransferase